MKIILHDADNGDCISIKSEQSLILIDGGTSASYDKWKNDFRAVELIDVVFITHIDDDHVNGVIRLLESNKIKIGNVIFNGIEQLLDEKISIKSIERQSNIKLSAIQAQMAELVDKKTIGFNEGVSLSYLLNSMDIQVNSLFNGEVLTSDNFPSFHIKDMKFHVIGPNSETINKLVTKWDGFLKDKKVSQKIISKKHALVFEAYINQLKDIVNSRIQIAGKKHTSIQSLSNSPYSRDPSLANDSSIAFIIESQGKKVLCLADCHVESILTWLDIHGINNIEVDAVKVSHHGSKHNINNNLLKRITCRNYLISTNGKRFMHPDLEALARIIEVNKDLPTNIYINNIVDHIPSYFLQDLNDNYQNINLIMGTRELNL
jgi:beta-lactamase superfamily II metal-dependent hydrolase